MGPTKLKVVLIAADRDIVTIKPLKIARSLARNGYEVSVVAWDRTGGRPGYESVDGCDVTNIRVRARGTGSLGPALVLAYLGWILRLVVYLVGSGADVYHPENLPNLLAAMVARVVHRGAIIYDISDFTADSSVWRFGARRVLATLERLCLRRADGVIIVDESRRPQLGDSADTNVAVVMNCPEGDDCVGASVESGEGFVVYFGGWIAESRGILQLCEAVDGLEGVRLVVAGFGAEVDRLRRVFDSRPNIAFKGWLDGRMSLSWTRSAELLVAFYDPRVPINRLASPNKVFDAMMCGTPILANEEALPVASIIAQEKCGVLVPYGDVGAIRRTILELRDDGPRRAEMRLNGRRAYERVYNWGVMEKRLLDLYANVTANLNAGTPRSLATIAGHDCTGRPTQLDPPGK